MDILPFEPSNPPWSAAHDTRNNLTALLSFTDKLDKCLNASLQDSCSFLSTMQDNFDKLFIMIVQIHHQQEENTKKLMDLISLIKDSTNYAMQPPYNLGKDKQPSPPITAPCYQFASAVIFHMEKGGPEPWLGHAVPCLPPLSCAIPLLNELYNTSGVYSCPDLNMSILPPSGNTAMIHADNKTDATAMYFDTHKGATHRCPSLAPDPNEHDRKLHDQPQSPSVPTCDTAHASLRPPPEPDPYCLDAPTISTHASLDIPPQPPPAPDPLTFHRFIPLAALAWKIHIVTQPEKKVSEPILSHFVLWLPTHHVHSFLVKTTRFLWPPPAPNLFHPWLNDA
jgi:hypothetical protein